MLVAALGCLALLSACERPFIAPVSPEIRVVEPDFSTVFLSASTPIRVEATSFRAIDGVAVDGRPMAFDSVRNAWEGSLLLKPGLNTFVLAATDVAGTVGVDTVFAVQMPFRQRAGPRLPLPRGGHTATLLLDGSLLVTGGADRTGGPAQADAFLLPRDATAFQRLPAGLHTARTGHTATLLPDGRVLLLGGSRTDDLQGVADLITSVEIYNPATQTFGVVPFAGQPIRRALHTATLRSEDLVDLYGGRGDIRYGTDPRLGTRRDMRTFRFTGEMLVALNTLITAPELGAAIWGHTQTPLTALAPGQPGRYLVEGTFFDKQLADVVSFKVDFTRPPQILQREAPPLLTPRTRHAAVLLQDGFVAFFGGMQATPQEALHERELYVDRAGRFFRFPAVEPPAKRYGHTATKLPSHRILLVGGFSTGGNSLRASEFFDSEFLN